MVLEHPPSFENRVEMLQRVSALLTEKRELEEEVVRKDSAIQEKAGENEALAEEKRRQEEESENTVERMQLVHSVEAEQNQAIVENLKGQLILNQDMMVKLETQYMQLTKEVEQQIAHKDSMLAVKDLTIADKDSMLASKDTYLQKNKTTIQSLNNQLTKTKDYLTSKPQVSSSTNYYCSI